MVKIAEKEREKQTCYPHHTQRTSGCLVCLLDIPSGRTPRTVKEQVISWKLNPPPRMPFRRNLKHLTFKCDLGLGFI